jgi:hypothetical protein
MVHPRLSGRADGVQLPCEYRIPTLLGDELSVGTSKELTRLEEVFHAYMVDGLSEALH